MCRQECSCFGDISESSCSFCWAFCTRAGETQSGIKKVSSFSGKEVVPSGENRSFEEVFSLAQKSVFITGYIQSFLFSLIFLNYLHQCPATESSTGCIEISWRVISLSIYKLMPF